MVKSFMVIFCHNLLISTFQGDEHSVVHPVHLQRDRQGHERVHRPVGPVRRPRALPDAVRLQQKKVQSSLPAESINCFLKAAEFERKSN